MAQGMWSGIRSGVNRIQDRMDFQEKLKLQQDQQAFREKIQQVNQNRQDTLMRQQQQQLAGNQELAMNPGLVEQMRSGDNMMQPGMRGSMMMGPASPKMNQMAIASHATPAALAAARDYRSPEQLSQMTINEKQAGRVPVDKEKYWSAEKKRFFDAYGREPQNPAEFVNFMKSTKSSTNLEVTPDGTVRMTQGLPGREKSYNREGGKQDAIRFDAIVDQLDLVDRTRSMTNAARGIFKSGLGTGALQPLKAKIAAYAEGLGIDPKLLGLESASSAQALTQIVMKNLLVELQKQKGPQTEGDAERALKTFVSLGNTPEANEFILDYLNAWAIRSKEKARFFIDARRGGNNDYASLALDWSDKISGMPLFAASQETGLPVTFYDYKAALKKEHPEATEEDIKDTWINFSRGN